MTATPDILWLGLDPADGGVDERHLEHQVLDLLAGLHVEADLVCTHVVVSQGLTCVAASVRLAGRAGEPLGETALLDALRERWSGAAVLEGPANEPSVETGPRDARTVARTAVAQARDGLAGRAVRFPGQEALGGPLPVADVPLVSTVTAAIPAVGELGPDTVLDPSGHVRPHFEQGRLVLLVRPGPAGTMVPVEKLNQHACAGH
ncbi:MAG: hypothetical protein M3353_08500 [Actinomycetota bacterium]|nr:hypothetical protein [Actinomycetota bacterium]